MIYVTNVEAFDRRAVELGLWRLVRGAGALGGGYERVPVNARIAKRLFVSASTVASARRGEPVASSFVAAVVVRFGVSIEDMFLPATAPEPAGGVS